MHLGIDISAALGTEILATADGIVAYSDMENEVGLGNLIRIKHNEVYTTAYAHLDKIFVKEGQKVRKGDVIGHVGNTGVSAAPHLHYEVYKNGKQVDPGDFTP